MTAKTMLLTAAVLMLASGCAKQQFTPVEKICTSGTDKVQAMKACEDVLAGMKFTIDKSDSEAGIIRTNPLSGAQFFELWRDDSVGAYNTAESNLHTLRRVAELNIEQKDGRLCVSCNATAQRLSLPEQEVSSSSRVNRMFSNSRRSQQKLEFNRDQKKKVEWIDLGRDSRLETEILKRIEKQI